MLWALVNPLFTFFRFFAVNHSNCVNLAPKTLQNEPWIRGGEPLAALENAEGGSCDFEELVALWLELESAKSMRLLS